MEFKSKGLHCCIVFLSSTKCETRHCSHAMMAKKCAKKHDARAKLLFCQSDPIAFLPSCCRRHHHCLSFLIGAITPNTSRLRSHNKFLGDLTVDTSFATAASNLNDSPSGSIKDSSSLYRVRNCAFLVANATKNLVLATRIS